LVKSSAVRWFDVRRFGSGEPGLTNPRTASQSL
jgi:hypothetical protein